MGTFVILQDFREQMLSLLDDLLCVFPGDTKLYAYRFLVSDKLPMQGLMDTFRANVLPHRHKIKKKDESFFLTSNTIFPEEDKHKFREMWTSEELQDEDKNVIWKYFNVFIDLALRYENSV